MDILDQDKNAIFNVCQPDNMTLPQSHKQSRNESIISLTDNSNKFSINETPNLSTTSEASGKSRILSKRRSTS